MVRVGGLVMGTAGAVPSKFIFIGRSIKLGWWVASRGWGNGFVHRILMVRVGGLAKGSVGGRSNQIYIQGPMYKLEPHLYLIYLI